MAFNVITNFTIAIALGALIGIERERVKTKMSLAGVRTFTFITFLGALASFLHQEFDNPSITLFIFSGLAILIAISYFQTSKKGYVGITTEVSSLIAFFIGFLAMFDKYRIYAIVFGVILTVILSLKDTLHGIIKKTKDVEWNDTLRFAVIAFVVLPLLPEEVYFPILPDGEFDVLNTFYPREVWLMVVFVSGISFIGYFLIKLIGNTRGVGLTGAVGGIVSSTAVTSSMASYSKCQQTKEKDVRPFVLSTILASAVAFIRVVVVSLGINGDLRKVSIPLIIMALVGILLVANIWRKTSKMKTSVKLDTPFALKPAITLGIIFFIVSSINRIAILSDFSEIGIFITSLIGGFADVDAVILSVASLSSQNEISTQLAVISILITVIANMLSKSVISLISGTRDFARGVILRFLLLIIIGAVSIFLVL